MHCNLLQNSPIHFNSLLSQQIQVLILFIFLVQQQTLAEKHNICVPFQCDGQTPSLIHKVEYEAQLPKNLIGLNNTLSTHQSRKYNFCTALLLLANPDAAGEPPRAP